MRRYPAATRANPTVERVAVESGEMADGRFSVNGWFLEDEG